MKMMKFRGASKRLTRPFSHVNEAYLLERLRTPKQYTSDRHVISTCVFQKKMDVLRWTFLRKEPTQNDVTT